MKEARPMMTIFKALLSQWKYCGVLTSPHRSDEIAELENGKGPPHGFSIFGIGLKPLKLYSAEFRCRKYIIIHTWDILEGLAPNLHAMVQ